MDPTDESIRAAMSALGGQTPRDYFDELPQRIDRRLEAEGSMQSELDGPGTNDDSGLHDIQSLARTQKQRIARRTSQHDAIEESLLASSSGSLLAASNSGLHAAIALPDPARAVSLPSVEEARELAATATAKEPARAREKAAAKKRGAAPWLLAGGGLAAAAAALLVFTQMNKTDDGATKAAAPAPAAAEQQAAAPTTPPPEPAAAAAPTVQPLDEGITTSGTTVEPLAPPPGEQAVAVATPDDAKKDEARAKKADRADERDNDRAQTKTDKKIAPKADDAAKKDAPAPKLDGAVIGEGDKDELGIGDVLRGGNGPTEKKPSKTELSSKEIRAGLDAINGDAKSCYDKYNVAGTVKVKLTIDPSGSVSKASATGDFAGTPTGDCVASAVKGASFPSWDGAPQSTTFVVLLSD